MALCACTEDGPCTALREGTAQCVGMTDSTDPPPALLSSTLRLAASSVIPVLGVLLVVFAVGLAILYSVQRDYYRKVGPRVAHKHGLEVAAEVAKRYALTGQFPASLTELPGLPEKPAFVADVALSASGVLHVVVADAPDGENLLKLFPSVQPGGQLVYTCRSISVAAELSPAQCVRD